MVFGNKDDFDFIYIAWLNKKTPIKLLTALQVMFPKNTNNFSILGGFSGFLNNDFIVYGLKYSPFGF